MRNQLFILLFVAAVATIKAENKAVQLLGGTDGIGTRLLYQNGIMQLRLGAQAIISYDIRKPNDSTTISNMSANTQFRTGIGFVVKETSVIKHVVSIDISPLSTINYLSSRPDSLNDGFSFGGTTAISPMYEMYYLKDSKPILGIGGGIITIFPEEKRVHLGIAAHLIYDWIEF